MRKFVFVLMFTAMACDSPSEPETQREACQYVAEELCAVSIDCSPNDNLSDYDGCVAHSVDHCLLHHDNAPDSPAENWEACKEALETEDVCRANSIYGECFNEDFR